MSHTIILNATDVSLYRTTCDNLESTINKILSDKELSTEIKNYANDLLKQIVTTRSQLTRNFATNSDMLNFLSSISTLEKNVTNTYLGSINFKLSKLYDVLEANKFSFKENVAKHGLLAIEVIQYLRSNKIEVNNENFNKYLKHIEEEKLSEERARVHINQAIEQINDSKFPVGIKKSLINFIREKKDINQIKDIPAIIQSKNNEFVRMETFITQKFFTSLKAVKFKMLGNIDYSYDEQNNVITAKFNMKNESNNTIQIKLDSNLNISYKLGNYIGHACEKTTEKIIKDLERQGVSIYIVDVKRDYEQNNQKVMYIDNTKNNGGKK